MLHHAEKVVGSSARNMATKAGIVAPLSNRFYFWNCVFKVPMSDQEFFEFWAGNARYVQKQEHFVSLHLYRCIGPESKFQWINFVVFDSDDVCVLGKPDPVWKARLQRAHSGLKAYPGQFSEIASYNGESLTDATKHRPDNARFLITTVSVDDSVSSEDLESNWKSWMQVDFIHEQLSGNTHLRDSLLYRLVKSSMPFVGYVVRTELLEMSDKDGVGLAKLVDEKQNADGVETFTGFYKVHTNM